MFKKGFTIIETIMSIFLVVTVLTAVIYGLTSTIKMQSYNQDLRRAVVLTVNELEQKDYDSLSTPTINSGLFEQSTAVKLSGSAREVTVTTAWENGSYTASRWFYPE